MVMANDGRFSESGLYLSDQKFNMAFLSFLNAE
jgi:hypothetical protein